LSEWLDVADITPRIAYTATASQTVFTVPFVFFEDEDLFVYQNTTLLVLATHYTVSGAEDEDGGTVTLLTGATAGDIIMIMREVPYSQTTHIPPSGPLDIPAINIQISKLVAMIQQIEDRAFDRAVRLSDSDPTIDLQLPNAAGRANKTVSFDADGLLQMSTVVGGEIDPDAANITFTPSGTGSQARSIQSRLRDYWSTFDFIPIAEHAAIVAGTSSYNATPALNYALEACYDDGKRLNGIGGAYMVDEASSGAGYALLNKGVSIFGEGSQRFTIAPLATMPNTADFMRVEMQTGGDLGFMEMSHILIYCARDGTKRGKRGIYLLDNVTANISRLHLHDIYVTPGNDYSLQIENNPALNAQGCPSNSVIERCAFWEGTHMTYIGDNVIMRNNILRSTGSRVGCEVYLTDASGTASFFIFEQNNCDCAGGALLALNGGRIRVLNNNIELSAGAGTSNGAVIDIDGSSGTIPFAEVCGNHVGIFGTATATSAIRINGTLGAKADHNTLLAGITIGTGIVVTSSATDAILGYNEISSDFTTKISDSGVGTRGVLKALTLVNSFANVGSGYDDAACKKDSDGTVHLVGFLSCPANPANLGIATLPAGFRPLTAMRFHVWGVVTAADAYSTVEIDTSGNITFKGANTFDQLVLNGISFPTTNYVVASL
jgi:hypothetical protein